MCFLDLAGNIECALQKVLVDTHVDNPQGADPRRSGKPAYTNDDALHRTVGSRRPGVGEPGAREQGKHPGRGEPAVLGRNRVEVLFIGGHRLDDLPRRRVAHRSHVDHLVRVADRIAGRPAASRGRARGELAVQAVRVMRRESWRWRSSYPDP